MGLRRSLAYLKRVHVAGLLPMAQVLLKTVLFLSGGLVSVEGGERLKGLVSPVIFAFNHNIYAETIIVPCQLMRLTGRKISFLIHWMFREFPYVGWLMRFIDPIWVYSKPRGLFGVRRPRGRAGTSAIDEAVRRYRRGASLGIFPEGTRNNNPRTLLRGRRGLGEIALRTGAAVVPVGIEFPGAAGRRRIPWLGKMILRVGETVDITGELARVTDAMQSGAGLTHEERGLLFALGKTVTERVMRALAVLSGKAFAG